MSSRDQLDDTALDATARTLAASPQAPAAGGPTRGSRGTSERARAARETIDARSSRAAVDASEDTIFAPASPRAPGASTPELSTPLAETLLSRDDDSSLDATTPTTTENLASRTRIGRYLVLRKLGEGGMGEVFAAYDEELDRRVALKLVHNRLGGSTVGRARMQREAQAMARLSHPNVVQVHDVGDHDGQVFVAMEFVKGETLSVWQRRQDATTEAGRRAIIEMYSQAGRGLAAAHAAGLVHRDFKPDNVLVGLDGRARVLDFGLAASHRDGGLARAPTAALTPVSASILDSDLTQTGSVMGTPAYMAPEQFLADPTDERTDQYSFCAALYEALYGEQPFAGDTFVARQLAVTGGELREPPARSRVPAWLRAVLVRGLAREAEARHPDMGALLDALARDPALRRRRRARQLGALAAAALVSVALLLAVNAGLKRWREHARQRDALTRLEQLDARLDALAREGNEDGAARAFTHFVEAPENRATDALALAWLHRAARELDAGDQQAVVNAYAAAYTIARRDEHRVASLRGLVRFLRDQLRWRDFQRAFATLEEALGDPPDDAAYGRLAHEAAVASRDFSGALARLDDDRDAALRPVLEQLARATPTELFRANALLSGSSDDDGDGHDELALLLGERELSIAVARAEPTLGPVATLETDSVWTHALRRRADEPRLFVRYFPASFYGGPRDEVGLLRREGDRLVEEFRWPEEVITTALSFDFDGDGVDNTYLGTGPYTRHLVELARGADGEWSTRHPAPELDARGSDVVKLLAADLDGDGTAELIAALGPWSAYEVQILRLNDETGTFELVTRRKLGNIRDAALLDQGDGTRRIAVYKNRSYSNRDVFPPDKPDGEPNGLYVLRFADDALSQEAFSPEPRLLDSTAYVREGVLIPADLDGDGVDELVVSSEVRSKARGVAVNYASVHARGPTGWREDLTFTHAKTVGAADLDGDGDDELIVTRTDDPDQRVWVLGAGDSSMPLVEDAATLDPRDAGPESPELASMWRHAHDLAAMGLPAQAADGLTALADLCEDETQRGRALIAAAALRERLHEDADASALYRRAISPSTLAAATRGAVRAAIRTADHASAMQLLDAALAPATSLDDDARAELERERAQLESLTRRSTELDFTTPLAASAWRIDRPLALRRDAFSRALHLDASRPGPLASLPVQAAGRYVTLELELELERAEYASSALFALVHGEGAVFRSSAHKAAPLAIRVATAGGATDIRHFIHCYTDGVLVGTAAIPFGELQADGARRLVARISLDRELEQATCSVRDLERGVLFYGRTGHESSAQLEPQQLRLALLHDGAAGTQLKGDLHRVTLRGVTTPEDPERAAAPPSPRARAAAALVEGDHAGALATLTSLDDAEDPELALWTVAALLELDRWDDAAAALQRARSSYPDESARGLASLIHADPRRYAPLLRKAADERARVDLLVEVWSQPFASAPEDPVANRVIFETLSDGIEEPDADPRAVFERLSLRATARARLEQHERARDDLQAALNLLERPDLFTDDAATRRRHERSLQLRLASALARSGELERARALLEALLAAGAGLWLIDQIHARPEFVPLLPDWPALAR